MTTAMTPAARARVYKLLTALLPLAAFYGLLSDTEVSLWLTLAAALLGSSGMALAAVHTPTGRHRKDT